MATAGASLKLLANSEGHILNLSLYIRLDREVKSFSVSTLVYVCQERIMKELDMEETQYNEWVGAKRPTDQNMSEPMCRGRAKNRPRVVEVKIHRGSNLHQEMLNWAWGCETVAPHTMPLSLNMDRDIAGNEPKKGQKRKQEKPKMTKKELPGRP